MRHERNTYATLSQIPLRTAFEPDSAEPPGVGERGDVQRPTSTSGGRHLPGDATVIHSRGVDRRLRRSIH